MWMRLIEARQCMGSCSENNISTELSRSEFARQELGSGPDNVRTVAQAVQRPLERSEKTVSIAGSPQANVCLCHLST